MLRREEEKGTVVGVCLAPGEGGAATGPSESGRSLPRQPPASEAWVDCLVHLVTALWR